MKVFGASAISLEVTRKKMMDGEIKVARREDGEANSKMRYLETIVCGGIIFMEWIG